MACFVSSAALPQCHGGCLAELPCARRQHCSQPIVQAGPSFPTLAKAIVFQASTYLLGREGWAGAAWPLLLSAAHVGGAVGMLGAPSRLRRGTRACVVRCLSPTVSPAPLPPPSTMPQQLATRAAAKIYGRVLTTCGCSELLTPEALLAASAADLRSAGLSERKALYLQDLARHFADGRLSDARIAGERAAVWGMGVAAAARRPPGGWAAPCKGRRVGGGWPAPRAGRWQGTAACHCFRQASAPATPPRLQPWMRPPWSESCAL